MAHYRGELQGGRGQATRLGHKKSGLRVAAYTWDHRVTVELSFSEVEQRDYVWIGVDNQRLVSLPLDELAKGSKALLEAMAFDALGRHVAR